MIIDEVIGAILQIIVFSLIPFIFFLIKSRSVGGFLTYIGLYGPTKKAVLWAVLSSLIILLTGVGLILISNDLLEVMLEPGSITGKIRAMGFGIESLATLLIIAIFKTSLSEEILFRGFIAKRLISVLGFKKGNLVQATLFGLIHLGLFLGIMQARISFLIYIFLLSGTGAYVMCFINEKFGKGSIIPGWIAHGLGNTLSYTLIAFIL